MEKELLEKIDARLAAQEAKIAAIYVSAEKTRKYLMWTAIITVAMIVLPLIGLAFAIPSYLSQLNTISSF